MKRKILILLIMCILIVAPASAWYYRVSYNKTDQGWKEVTNHDTSLMGGVSHISVSGDDVGTVQLLGSDVWTHMDGYSKPPSSFVIIDNIYLPITGGWYRSINYTLPKSGFSYYYVYCSQHNYFATDEGAITNLNPTTEIETNFTANVTTGSLPLPVQFTIDSPWTVNITNVTWTFGDGTQESSSLDYIDHTYTGAGLFDVTLEYYNETGYQKTATRLDYIHVLGTGSADFTCSPLTGTPPVLVNCTDESTNSPTSWTWKIIYEDIISSPEYTTEDLSIYLYDPGNYTVNHTATGGSGTEIEIKEDYIFLTNWTTPTPTPTPNQWGKPDADFSGTPLSSSHAPLTVTFTDQSTNTPSSWLWEFGDGWGSTVKNPTHTYASAGTYTVSLTATNGWGSDQETKANYVTVAANDTPDPPGGTGFVKGHTYKAGDYNTLIGGVTVTLYNATWSDNTTSSAADGYYKFVNVSAGSYNVNGTKTNYTASTDYVITVYDQIATTQDIALSITPANETATPTPTQLVVYAHMVRFTFRDINDNPFENLNVTATMQESTSPWTWLASIFGFTTTEDPKNVTLSGSTGSDGSWSALMIPNVRYNMKAWTADDSVNMTWSLYPQETDYLYIIQENRTPDLGDTVFFNLTHTRINSSYVRINWYYNDTLSETGSFHYFLINQTDPENATYIIDVTTGGSYFDIDYDIYDVIKGAQFVWGFEANHSTFGTIEKNAGITLPGGEGERLIEIGLNDDEYLWLCLTLIVVLTAMFSSFRKVMLGCIVVPLFTGSLWFIGWFDTSFAIFIVALTVGVMGYLLNREIRTGI